jgi:hypothetical protein
MSLLELLIAAKNMQYTVYCSFWGAPEIETNNLSMRPFTRFELVK